MEITPLLLLYPTIHHNKQIIKNHRKNVSQDKMNRNINAKEKYRRSFASQRSNASRALFHPSDLNRSRITDESSRCVNITQAVISNHLSNVPRCLQPSKRQSRRHDRRSTHDSRRSAANPHGTPSTREIGMKSVSTGVHSSTDRLLTWNGDESASGRSPWKIRFPQSLPALPEGNKYGGALPLELRWLHLVVAVSYQKINTPVAHQYRGFFLETRSHPLATISSEEL